jgi:hypothetical protein
LWHHNASAYHYDGLSDCIKRVTNMPERLIY